MGIYDRDYYREPTRAWGGGFGIPGTLFLIGLTVGLYFFEALSTRQQHISPLLQYGAFEFDKIAQGEVWRLFSTGFIPEHNLFSVILSLILLYWAGKEIERHFGTRTFVAFYVLAAWAGAFAKLGIGLAGIDTRVVSFGNSGALFAVLVLFACLNPRRTILVFFFLPMPIVLLVTILLGLAVLSMLGDGTKIHAVGVIAGAGFGFAFFRVAPEILERWHRRLPRNRSRAPVRIFNDLPTPEPDVEPPRPQAEEPTRPRSNRVVDEQLEAKLDQVLSKVAKQGRASLNSEELEILQRASEIYKKKRS